VLYLVDEKDVRNEFVEGAPNLGVEKEAHYGLVLVDGALNRVDKEEVFDEVVIVQAVDLLS